MAELVNLSSHRRIRPAIAGDGGGELPLVERLAFLLHQLVEEPLLVLPSDGVPFAAAKDMQTELRLAQFKPELAAQAEALLEEAGF